MIYPIFRNNVLVTNVKPFDTSELSQKKQQEDIVRLNFELTNFVELKIGDYIIYNSEYYYLNKLPRISHHPKKFTYECIFEGSFHEFYKTKVFLYTQKSDGSFYKDYKFPLTGTAETFLYLIVENLNRNGSGYTIGEFKETNSMTIQFNNWNVFEAISYLSEQLVFDWYLNGKQLNFDSRTFENVNVLQVGRGVGLTDLIRLRVDQEHIKTVVYGYGATKNLPPRNVYDGEILTEHRLSFEGEEGESKLSKNMNLYGIREEVKEFDSIYPEYSGIVTEIFENDLFSFVDENIDFNVNDYLLSDIQPKINFLTGKLIGRTFSITFDNLLQKFTLTEITEGGEVIPNDLINISLNDTYTIFDISMPESYITDAQTRLEESTQEYLDEKSKRLELFEAHLDEYFVREKDLELTLGDLIRVVSSEFNIDFLYEIKELIRNINNENLYRIKFGDILPKSLITQIANNNFNAQQDIFNVQNTQITNNSVTNIIGEEVAWEQL